MNTKNKIIPNGATLGLYGATLGLFFGLLGLFIIIGQAEAGIRSEEFTVLPETFDKNLECNIEQIQPVSYGMKGSAVTELQKCLKAYDRNLKVTGKYDKETKRSVKDFYSLLFRPKKTSGKKFDKKMVMVFKELYQVWQEVLIADSSSDDVSSEDGFSEELDTETRNAQVNTESFLNNKRDWLEVIQNCPSQIKKSVAFFYDYIELTPQEQAQYDKEAAAIDAEFQNAASEFDAFGQQSQDTYDAGNYKEANVFAEKAIAVYGKATDLCNAHKNEPSLVYKKKADVLLAEQHAEEDAREKENAAKYKEDIRLGKETLGKIFEYFRFTVPAGYTARRSVHSEENLVFVVDLFPENTAVYGGSPMINVEVRSGGEEYTSEIFDKEMMSGETLIGKGGGGEDSGGIKAKKIMLGGIPWYRVIESKAPVLGKDRAVIPLRVSTFFNGFIYTIAFGDGGETEPNILNKVRGDFEKMIKTLSIR